jgi:fructose-1,6-bisphosphatase I
MSADLARAQTWKNGLGDWQFPASVGGVVLSSALVAAAVVSKKRRANVGMRAGFVDAPLEMSAKPLTAATVEPAVVSAGSISAPTAAALSKTFMAPSSIMRGLANTSGDHEGPIVFTGPRHHQSRGAKTVRRASGVATQPAFKVDDLSGVCEQTGVTLNRYMIELTKRGVIDTDIQSIFSSIQEATKVIAKLVNRAPLAQAELLGLEGDQNVHGEDQKKLDIITNDVLKNALRYSGKLGTMASEEEDEPVAGSEADPVGSAEQTIAETGKYVCVFDPLDGSSNVDAGIAVGTIFGIFSEDDAEECEIPDSGDLSAAQIECLASTLQPGKALVAAGYVLYSCSTELVFTTGQGTVGFTLDPSIGEYVLTRPHIVIPQRGKIYSMNEANFSNWDQPLKDYVVDIREGKGQTGKPYSLRYIGSMVGDVHRTLLYGGLFGYPADKKNSDGKLRLLYEAAPMSFIMEQAGGKSITGHSRVMEIPPTGVHQRVPVLMGSPEDVDEVKGYFDRCDDPELKKRCENRLKGITTK